jgi:hypothetical protein
MTTQPITTSIPIDWHPDTVRDATPDGDAARAALAVLYETGAKLAEV